MCAAGFMLPCAKTKMKMTALLQRYVDSKLNEKEKAPKDVFSNYCKGSLTWANEKLYMQKTALEDVIDKFKQHKMAKKKTTKETASGVAGKVGGGGKKMKKKEGGAAMVATVAGTADVALKKKKKKKKKSSNANGKSVVA